MEAKTGDQISCKHVYLSQSVWEYNVFDKVLSTVSNLSEIQLKKKYNKFFFPPFIEKI